MLIFGTPDNMTITGVEGGEVILEALAMPGETFGDYPTLYVFGVAMAINPKNNQPTEMTVRANEPYVMDEMALPGHSLVPTAYKRRIGLLYSGLALHILCCGK
jgi:hypothetical protein